MTAPAVLRRWSGPAPGSLVGAAVREQTVRLRRAAPLGAVLLSGLVAHVAVMPYLAVGGVSPDAPLVAVVAVAAGRGARAGAAFGFAAGLGADLFLATPLGTSALAYTLLGHALGSSRRPRRPGAAALCTPAATCFACRTGQGHGPPPTGATSSRPARLQRRAAARRAALRRLAVLTLLGVGAGRMAVAVVATTLGGVPFPGTAGLGRMAAVAIVSVPLGAPVFAALRRVGPSRRRP